MEERLGEDPRCWLGKTVSCEVLKGVFKFLAKYFTMKRDYIHRPFD